MKKVLVTGCAGFVGSNLVDELLKDKEIEIVGIDNYSTGTPQNLQEAFASGRFQNHIIDLTVGDGPIAKVMEGCDTVFHFAANADIRGGPERRDADLKQNIVATFNVLEAMVKCGVKTILFTSTAPVYGNCKYSPTPEYGPIATQASLYSASKLACEGYISSYCNYFGMESYIFRMVSLHGPRYSHGFAIDFYKKLRANPNRLEVLGDGKIHKSYLHVLDAIRAMLNVLRLKTAQRHEMRTAVYNLGLNEYVEVHEAAKMVAHFMGLKPEIVYQDKREGWPGDLNVYLDCSKILTTGWRPFFGLSQAVKSTIEYLKQREDAESSFAPQSSPIHQSENLQSGCAALPAPDNHVGCSGSCEGKDPRPDAPVCAS